MPEITKTQAQYLSYIYAYTESFGQPPAESEIAKAMKVQPPSVNGMLKTLEKKQLIRRKPNTPSSIEILVDSAQFPRWKTKLSASFQMYVPKDATKEQLDQILETLVEHRKANRRNQQSQNRIAEQRKPAKNLTVYRFKITLNQSKPPIWRRIETADLTLAKFHELIQAAMGWSNCHLHAFDIAGVQFIDTKLVGDEFGAVDYKGIRLSDLVRRYGVKLKMRYEYDFGDGWQHTVVLEAISQRTEPADHYPRCIAGKRACPPEDVGGIWGFTDFLTSIADPQNEQYEELIEWSGPYDPNEFDKDEVTKFMQYGIPSVYGD